MVGVARITGWGGHLCVLKYKARDSGVLPIMRLRLGVGGIRARARAGGRDRVRRSLRRDRVRVRITVKVRGVSGWYC